MNPLVLLLACAFPGLAAAAGWTDITPPTERPAVVPAEDWFPIQFIEANESGSALFVHATTAPDDSGWLRSADHGATWSRVALPAEATSSRLLTVPGHPSSVFAVEQLRWPGRIWYSNDAGSTWQQVPMSAPPREFGFSTFSPVGPQPGVIYGSWRDLSYWCFAKGGYICAPPGTAIRSSDGGRTWASMGLTGGSMSVVGAASDVTTAYATSTAGIFRTRDSGASWVRIWPAPQTLTPAARVVVDAHDPLVVYAQVFDDGALEQYWATEDGGGHWRALPPPTPTFNSADLPLPDPVDSRRAFVVDWTGDVFETLDAGRSWKQHVVGPPGFSYWRLFASGTRRSVIATDGLRSVRLLDLSAPHPIALGTDLWWNPAQPGWGLSVAQHATNQVFAVWFTYDAQGKPIWRFVPGGTWTDTKTFTGGLYASSVAPRNFFASTFMPPAIEQIGQATLRFDDSNTGEAIFIVRETMIRQPISRMAFGPVDKTQLPMADLWFNPSQSGWGIGVHQQYSTVFATWFLYDDDGAATWLFLPNATSALTGVSGEVYRATTSPGIPYEARSVSVTRMGTARLEFGAISATISGRDWSSPITRMSF